VYDCSMSTAGVDNSGSGWGQKELDTYRFQKEARRSPFENFPWADLFPSLNKDPITDISQTLDDIFGPEAESGESSSADNASIFYDMLRGLTGAPVERYGKNVPQTRSKVVDYSSPSLPSASTQRHEGTISKKPASEPPYVGLSPSHAGWTTLDHPWLRRYPHPEFDRSDDALEPLEREQSPIAALLQRRGVEVEDFDATPVRSIAWNALENSAQFATPRIDRANEGQSASPEDVMAQLLPLAGGRIFPPSPCGQGLTRILASETNLPSSESGSTYRASSMPILTSSPPIFVAGSSPPPAGAPKYADQAEEGTNSMMYALLLHICSLLSRCPAPAPTKTVFSVSHNVEPLRVPTGDGGFIKTIPDLEVMAERGSRSIPVLDYEVSKYI
jgi:hypothetical protein